MNQKGSVYWITGLSGSGKSTISHLLLNQIKEQGDTVIYLDGDTIREVYGSDLGYTVEDRRICAGRNSRLCKMISDQGIDVLCSTICMFNACREWNRNHIQQYFEIYIKVSDDILKQRQKEKPGHASADFKKDMVEFNGIYEEPQSPDLVVVNDGLQTPEEIADILLKHINDKRRRNCWKKR